MHLLDATYALSNPAHSYDLQDNEKFALTPEAALTRFAE
jgi:hypothetical protein